MDLRFHPQLLVSTWIVWFRVGAAVCTALLSLVSVLISGSKASSFRQVVGLSTSGANSQLFKKLHVFFCGR
jgi:hypothetical protein